MSMPDLEILTGLVPNPIEEAKARAFRLLSSSVVPGAPVADILRELQGLAFGYGTDFSAWILEWLEGHPGWLGRLPNLNPAVWH